ncbi:MAG: hypothetical protein JW983_04620 [Elusimicrobia bacterium]|nr:hypothetical protein [Elusimicrobiota bacterium]
MRAGVIDIGSNSIKLSIGELVKKDIKILEHLKNIVPIGKHTFLKGRISQEIINQTVSILGKYKQVLDEYETRNVIVIATTAVREARNRDIFIDAVLRRTGFKIEVFTAGDVVYYSDSYLSYMLKKTYPIHMKNLLIAELGAGSLDVSMMGKGLILSNFALPVGTMRIRQLMNKLDGSMEENHEVVKEYIGNAFQYLKRNIPEIHMDDIILIDENYSLYIQQILAREKKEEEKFYQLGAKDAETFMMQLVDKRVEEIAREYKIPLDIADVITEYAIILNNFFSLTKNKHIYIFNTSLAEAILANILLNVELAEKYNKTNQLVSAARFLCRKFNVDLNHAKQVAHLSQVLFDALKGHLGINEEDSLYLILAAYLRDIGLFIHNRSHHKHTEYIISCSRLFRLTDDEVKIIACIARYHRRGTPKNTHVLYSSLPLDKQILVQKLSALLRIANSLDASHKQKVKSLQVKLNRNQDVTLIVETYQNFTLEKMYFLDRKEYFEEITGNKVNLAVQNTP